jgi:hypothetical protein
LVEEKQPKLDIPEFDNVRFLSVPDAWNSEKEAINCTIRIVDQYDHRFHALRLNIPRTISIVNTETREVFTRKLRWYHEFDFTAYVNVGFARPSPGTEQAVKIRMAKIVWWDEPGFARTGKMLTK